MPAVKRNRRPDLVGFRPLSHRHRGQQIGQAAIEPHRRDDRHAGCMRGVVELLEGRTRGCLLRRHVQIVDA